MVNGDEPKVSTALTGGGGEEALKEKAKELEEEENKAS